MKRARQDELSRKHRAELLLADRALHQAERQHKPRDLGQIAHPPLPVTKAEMILLEVGCRDVGVREPARHLAYELQALADVLTDRQMYDLLDHLAGAIAPALVLDVIRRAPEQ